MTAKDPVGKGGRKNGLEFTFYFIIFLVTGSAVFCSYQAMKYTGVRGWGPFYLNLSWVQWPFLFFLFKLARTEARSALKGGVADFWLDDEEAQNFIDDSQDKDFEKLAGFYKDLPLKRWRAAQIHYGLYRAFKPALAAWLGTATAACLVVRDFSPAAVVDMYFGALGRLFTARPISLLSRPEWPVTYDELLIITTLANLAGLSLGSYLYVLNRRRAAAILPRPPLVSLENVNKYQGRSHL